MPKLPDLPAAPTAPEIGRPDVLVQRGYDALEKGEYSRAIELYRRALAIDPTFIDAINGLGTAAGVTGDLLTAIQQFENSLRIYPDQHEAWFNHGSALLKVGLIKEALGSFHRSIALAPEFAAAYLALSSALSNLARYDEALAAFTETLRLLPDDPVTAKQHGIALQWRGDFDLALKEFERSIALYPEHAEAWVSKAMLLLTLGDLPAGFKLYEWRFRMVSWLRSPWSLKRRYPTPLWLGEPSIKDKALFIFAEQGFGDMIQFCRYVTLAARTGARVILGVPDELVVLMKTLDGPARVVSDNDPTPEHDFHCPIMSLPLALGTTMETIPASVPYLRADPARSAKWRERLSALPDRRVGLVWAAGSRVGDDEMVAIEQRKSMPLSALGALASVAGCSFVSLQLGPHAKQAASPPPGLILHDYTADLKDFADTAALMENLDLVISVCTSTAHLAGALARPVWLLNRYDTDWRWFLDRDDSPWYPTMRLFRQDRPADWTSAIRSMVSALRTFVGAG